MRLLPVMGVLTIIDEIRVVHGQQRLQRLAAAVVRLEAAPRRVPGVVEEHWDAQTLVSHERPKLMSCTGGSCRRPVQWQAADDAFCRVQAGEHGSKPGSWLHSDA